MAVLSTQPIGKLGASPTFAAAGGSGDRFTPNDKVALIVKNGSGSPITATLTTPNTVNTLAIADNAVAVAAGATAVIPLPADLYASSDGLGDVAYSATSSVTVAVVQLP